MPPFHFDRHITERMREAGQSLLPFWIFLASYGMWLFAPFIGVFMVKGVMPWVGVVIPVLLTHALTLLLQQMVRRERPPIEVSRIKMWRRTPSFPSAHASGSMAFALAISAVALSFGESGIPVTVFVLLLALLIGVSRIIVGVHYVTDVVCGFIFGILVTGIFLLVA